MPQDVYVEIGELPQTLVGRYGRSVDVNDKNFGLNFYTMDWSSDQPATVVIRNGSSKLQIDAALMINGAFDKGYPDEGISSYSVSSELVPQPTVLHDHARLKFFEILARIQKAGWTWLIYQTQPRLRGGDLLRYQLESSPSMGSLDPSFEPSLRDWMRLEDDTSWRFYKDGVYMDIRLSRDAKRMKVDEPGAYFISISLESYQSFWRTTFKEQDRARWRELLPAVRERQRATRAEVEKKLQAEGYRIDTGYRNPDDELEPDAKAPPPASNKPTPSAPTPAPQPPSSLKERLGRWIKGN